MKRRLREARRGGALSECYRDFLTANADPARATANTTLFMVLKNAAERGAADPRVRRLVATSRVFAEKLLAAEGAEAVLLAAGFERHGNVLELPPALGEAHLRSVMATLISAIDDSDLAPRIRVSAASSAAAATKELILRRMGLADLPPAISTDSLRAIKVLDLSRNRLQRLPHAVVSHCLGLEELYVAHNEISQLPTEIHRLQELRLLRLDHNPLAAIPGELSLLPSLLEFSFVAGGVRNVPRSVMRRGSTAELLDYLHATFFCGAALMPGAQEAELTVARDKRRLLTQRHRERRSGNLDASPAKPRGGGGGGRAWKKRHESMYLDHEVQDVAALRIQVAWRAFVYRMECWRLRQRKARDEPWPEEEEEEEEKKQQQHQDQQPPPDRAEQEWQRRRAEEREAEEAAAAVAEARRRRRSFAAESVQGAWRRARRRRSEGAAVQLQAALRGRIARRRFSETRASAVAIQSLVRGQRAVRIAHRLRRERREAREREQAATTLQALVRGGLARRSLPSPPASPLPSPVPSPVASPVPVPELSSPEPSPEPPSPPREEEEVVDLEKERKLRRKAALKAQRKAAWDKMVADRRRRQAEEEAERLRREQAAAAAARKVSVPKARGSPVMSTTRLQVERRESKQNARVQAARRHSRVGGGFRLATDLPLWQQL